MKRLKTLLLSGLVATGMLCSQATTFVGEREDFRDETIYFAMTTRFYDGDPANNVCGWDHQDVQREHKDPDWRGDFKGLIDKLDYIKALGFTTVWITPIVQNCSGTDFHGYHAMDFSSVDLRYESRKTWGSEQDVRFQDLIDAAHAKGMKIVLDIVLNHTGNFGEAHFAPLFTRSQDIRNQASVSASIIPDASKLGSDYNDVDGKTQYNRRFPYLKNSDGTNKDSHNYWHHVGTGWNWDYPNRWWGQIAGDCVDLNTENPAVSKYLVECYGKFIEMGVDGFRIDTTGHISRLTFNTSFIPQFHEIAEKNKSKRLNGCPFFMFGECCARFSDVTYRNQPNLSSYFYTWKSPADLVAKWNNDPTFWDNIFIKEGDDSGRYGNMALCDAEPSDQPTSDNVFMKNGQWHQPDYSKYSGFSIIDFPMHYNFNNAGAAVNVAKNGDKYYNDASYNVVYVDSHDYCPGPNDGTRFNGGTEQWAENLSLMFTFRGIPCIYYGSEVEFQKGMKVDAGGTDTPVSQSGRAYFGAYLEGNVTASDFGEFTASGNVAETLDGDLSQHIIRLNKIRAAVPALRKGQYTFDGCSAQGGWAFKRAYKDSYALVAINGGATFSGVPAGTYVDLVTGEKYQGGGSITVKAPSNKGQLRVLVKDWKGGKVGEDGKFMYATSPVAHGGKPSFADTGATRFYTAEDAIGTAAVKFTPGSGAFRTETLTVTAKLNEAATSGSIEVGSQRISLTKDGEKSFVIGKDMTYGQTTTVKWEAKGADGVAYKGEVTYKKVDPNASITVYVKAETAPNLYVWSSDANLAKEPNGPWPGKKLTASKDINGDTFWYFTADGYENINCIINDDKGKTADITGITSDVYYEYSGGSSYKELDDIVITPDPVVRFSPNGGKFTDDVITVTATARNCDRASYSINGGTPVEFTGSTQFQLGEGMAVGESATVTWTAYSATAGNKQGSVTFTKAEVPQGITVYYDNSLTNFSPMNIYYWSVESPGWPGVAMEQVEGNIYKYTVPTGTTGIIFNNGNGGKGQTVDVTSIAADHLYKGEPTNDKANVTDEGLYRGSGVEIIESAAEEEIIYFNLQGQRVENPSNGIFIQCRGRQAKKVYIP